MKAVVCLLAAFVTGPVVAAPPCADPPPLEPIRPVAGPVAGPVAKRDDRGCAAVARALADERARAELAEREPSVDPEDSMGPRGESPSPDDVRRCTAELQKDGLFALESDIDSIERFAGGIAVEELAEVGQTLARGRSAAGAGTLRYNAVSFLGCGVHFPVLVDFVRPISGFYLDDRKRWLIAIHFGGRQYSGGVVPYHSVGGMMTIIDLRNLTSRQVQLEFGAFSVHSISVAVRGDMLLARVKDVWPSDRRAYVQCDLGKPKCSLDPTLAPTAFPRHRALEVTASNGVVLAPMPTTFRAPEGLLPRSIRPSPSGKRAAWVTQTIEDEESVRRTLWVGDASGGRATKIADGQGPFNTSWRDENILLYDADPAFAPAALAARDDVMKTPEFGALLEQVEEEGDEGRRMVEALAMQRVIESAASGLIRGVTPRNIQAERVMEYRVPTATQRPLPGSDHLRLYSEFQFANVRGDTVIEPEPDFGAIDNRR